jgi:hypothetical protein
MADTALLSPTEIDMAKQAVGKAQTFLAMAYAAATTMRNDTDAHKFIADARAELRKASDILEDPFEFGR